MTNHTAHRAIHRVHHYRAIHNGVVVGEWTLSNGTSHSDAWAAANAAWDKER